LNCFIGLGNPGREYDGTRHNIGFAVVDLMETKIERSSGWRAGKSDYYVAKGLIAGEEVLLVKPTTYMNLSGRAVRDVLAFYKCEIADLVVIADDIALPTGQLRLRLRGSDGGHNGLSSVIYELGTEEFVRLRLGVGSDFTKGEQVRYVLSRFKEAEKKVVDEMIEKAAGGCELIVKSGTGKAMNTINMKDRNEKDGDTV
jgi:PTH1 family peptidyl-tRNA hydrolase